MLYIRRVCNVQLAIRQVFFEDFIPSPIIPSKSFRIREEKKKEKNIIKHRNLNPLASYGKQCAQLLFYLSTDIAQCDNWQIASAII